MGNEPVRRVDPTGLQVVEGIFSGLGSGVGQIATDILGYLAARVEGTLMAARAIVSASLPNCVEVQVDVQWPRLGGVTIHAFKKAAPKPEVVVPPPARIIAAAMVRGRIAPLISRVAPSTHVFGAVGELCRGVTITKYSFPVTVPLLLPSDERLEARFSDPVDIYAKLHFQVLVQVRRSGQ